VALVDAERDAPSAESLARLRSLSPKIHVQVHGVGEAALQALDNYPRNLDTLVSNRQTSSGWKVVFEKGKI
jgi:hypothetical protein